MTIKEKVEKAKNELKLMTTHTQLREWAIANGMDNRSAFPKFKDALIGINIDYSALKMGIHLQQTNQLNESITNTITLITDAKASAGRFAICDADGEVLWYGRFFGEDDASEQSRAELCSAKKALWLASKIMESGGHTAIELNLKTDAQWLCYQDHAKQKGYVLTQLARKYNIQLNVEWIPGSTNPADKWTTSSGFKKWSDNDLKSLIKTK